MSDRNQYSIDIRNSCFRSFYYASYSLSDDPIDSMSIRAIENRRPLEPGKTLLYTDPTVFVY